MAKASTPRAVPKDWSKLNISGYVLISAHLDGLEQFTIGWEASVLVEVFQKLQHLPGMPRKMDWRHMRSMQEDCRQRLLADFSDQNINQCAMMLAWLGFLRVPRSDFDTAIKAIVEFGQFCIHVIFAANQWVFFGAENEQPDEVLAELMQATYPTKFSRDTKSGMRGCNHPLDPALLERVQKPFCMRLDWPGIQPLAYTMKREDVAHCLMHLDEMRDAPADALQEDIRRMFRERRPNHGMIIQALFYLCAKDPIFEAVGGVPTIDFAYIQPAHNWAIRFGRQQPGPENVQMIQSVNT